MPTRKIADTFAPCAVAYGLCSDREHELPNLHLFEPGVYEHECPSCGIVRIFTIDGIVSVDGKMVTG